MRNREHISWEPLNFQLLTFEEDHHVYLYNNTLAAFISHQDTDLDIHVLWNLATLEEHQVI